MLLDPRRAGSRRPKLFMPAVSLALAGAAGSLSVPACSKSVSPPFGVVLHPERDAAGEAPSDAAGDESVGDASAPPGEASVESVDVSAPPVDGASFDATLADAVATVIPPQCNGSRRSSLANPGPAPTVPPALTVPAGFKVEKIATLLLPRQLAMLPNGDLLVSTLWDAIYLIPDVEADGAVGTPFTFTSVLGDRPVQGVAYQPTTCTIYVASQHALYAIPYIDGEESASAGDPIAALRTGPIALEAGVPGADTDTHTTTSLAAVGDKLYVSIGSSCNACAEADPSRATIQQMDPGDAGMTARAIHFRNAIALALNPATGTLWAGGAGQDSLPLEHPFEFMDGVTLHAGVADYGWPGCEENRHPYIADADCSNAVVPRIALPAYSTLIGAAFYPSAPTGPYAFPAPYRGGLFISAHGSWHATTQGIPLAPPRVVFVPMNGDTPMAPVDWDGQAPQWTEFLGGFQADDGGRAGRPTGVAVGPKGSLFVADDTSSSLYRIRPM
jgi:glucose/arabinose dehydrogenase